MKIYSVHREENCSHLFQTEIITLGRNFELKKSADLTNLTKNYN